MTRLPIGGLCLAALGVLSGTLRADEPKPRPDPARALIDRLPTLDEPDVGYSATITGVAFPPLNQTRVYAGLLGGRPHATSDAMRSLVRLGVKAVPALLEHLGDDRPTRIVVEHASPFGGLFVDDETAPFKPLLQQTQAENPHTVRVGDLCYVALGQIVNRGYTAVRYQPTAIIFVSRVTKNQRLCEKLKREWGGLTPDKHRDLLAADLDSDFDQTRTGASLRLAYYYPAALEPLALRQLGRPAYDSFDVSEFVQQKLYPAKSLQDRKALVDAFTKQHRGPVLQGIEWQLFEDLEAQEADEGGRRQPRLDPKYQARECLVGLFNRPAGVRSADLPERQPLTAAAQAEFLGTLRFDRGDRLDRAVRDLLLATDDHSLAKGCLDRLVGRGFDGDIKAYLKRQLPRATEHERGVLKGYEGKLGWTRLHAAIDLRVPERVETALRDRPDVNGRAEDGRAALHLAAAAGDAVATDLLLNAKADPNVKNGRGELAVELASRADHGDVVRRLVAGGSAVPDVGTAAFVGDASRLTELLREKKARASERNGPGLTPLHIAARGNHVDAIRVLIDAGADVNAIDAPSDSDAAANGWTPLHLAVIAGNARAADLLLQRNASVNAADRRGNFTPLHYAAWAGDAAIVRLLLAGKADRGAKDKVDRTPLDLAGERNHLEVVKLLEAAK